mmetsp:Transcript_19047/g.28795  ORF Transcript_19047/g.28795 Transcript_19047/m.28795 type:complete len:84 (+) Transcript_19047:87-338(+)
MVPTQNHQRVERTPKRQPRSQSNQQQEAGLGQSSFQLSFLEKHILRLLRSPRDLKSSFARLEVADVEPLLLHHHMMMMNLEQL